MKEFSQKELSRTSLDRLIQKNDAHDTNDSRPGSSRTKSVRTIDNIAVLKDLICSQDHAPHPYSMWRPLS